LKLLKKHPTDRTYEFWQKAAEGDFAKVMNKICDGYNKDDFNLNKDSIIFALDIKFKKEDVVLDLGCGIGRTCKWVAPQVAKYIGVDFIPEMIKKARIHNKEFQNAEFIVNDGRRFGSLWGNTVDIVYCELAFQHMVKPVQETYVKEIFRVLKPNGKFYGQLPQLSYYKNDTYALSSEEAKELLKDFNMTWIQTYSKYPHAYFHFKAIKEITK
jgi:ubiquinone/menaquinone biosynthesis C-methylase UbiE